jgi:galactokinase
MDQSISLMGKSGHALLLDCRDLSTRQIRVDFANAALKLLIVDTRAHHALVDGGYAQRRAQCESVASLLGVKALRDLSLSELEVARGKLPEINFKRARHVITEISRVEEAVQALEIDDFEKFGSLMTESHISLRDDYNVSCSELDLAVDTALNEGALGARMVGGGFGGSAIALIRESDTGKVAAAIERSFKDNGFAAPRFFDSLPSEGAQVIDLD